MLPFLSGGRHPGAPTGSSARQKQRQAHERERSCDPAGTIPASSQRSDQPTAIPERRTHALNEDQPHRHALIRRSGNPNPYQPRRAPACRFPRHKADNKREPQSGRAVSRRWQSLPARLCFAMARHFSSADFYATPLPACRQLGCPEGLAECPSGLNRHSRASPYRPRLCRRRSDRRR